MLEKYPENDKLKNSTFSNLEHAIKSFQHEKGVIRLFVKNLL